MKTNTKIIIAKIIFRVMFFFGIKKDVIVNRNLINWKLDISEGIDLSIFLFGSFQQNLVLSINRHIFSHKKSQNNFFNIIDIGSNIGDKSLSITSGLLSKNFTNFKVFSIEPTDYAFKKQINNINLNPKLKQKIKSSRYFVSNNKIRPKNIYSSWSLNSNKDSHKIHKGILKKVNKSTKTISLDSFVKKNKIKDQIILKIDVDGFEMNVLKSAVQTLTKKNPIIFIEYAPYSFYEYGSSTKEFYNFLKKYNYKIYDLNFNKLNKIKIIDGSSTDIILIKN
ncbi:FkbM family methyltransferase [Candidatus Pelagibacter sp. Uisw_127]|uniref:FkbM family methyltransferase n=1 Tax=Candidatus Pelagibacter sp. Uisw_127 TaxID=3230988 RepID=UPI0039EC8536